MKGEVIFLATISFLKATMVDINFSMASIGLRRVLVDDEEHIRSD